ncbi:MAG: carboxypeptidase-like regulatory domain-containing protein [Oscillospiraceae bacterium]|nr:carboxypeptidase-like regulatory domain-containing protein [Oscillospiraceae bacterium]
MQQPTFHCKLGPGERVETKLTLTPDPASCIFGQVTEPSGTPLAGALALLFRIETDTRLGVPVAQMMTDADGHFAFGGLDEDVLYRVKVFCHGGKARVLEVSPL